MFNKKNKDKSPSYAVSMKNAPRLTEDTPFLQLVPIMIWTAVTIILTKLYQYTPYGGKEYWSNEKETTSEFFSHYKQVAIVICLILIILFVLYRLCASSLQVKKTWMYLPMAIYGLGIIVSFIFSEHKNVAWTGFNERFEGTYVLLAYVFMLFYIINTLRTEKDFKRIMVPLSIMALILGLLGLSQFIDFDFFRTTLGQKLITPSYYWPSVDQAAAKGERLLEFTFTEREIYQTVYNINYVGFYLTMMIPLWLYVFIQEKKIKAKIFYGFLFAITMLNFIGAASSAGMLGLFISALIAVFTLRRRLLLWWKQLIIAGLIMCAVLSVSTDFWWRELSSVISTFTNQIFLGGEEEEAETSTTGNVTVGEGANVQGNGIQGYNDEDQNGPSSWGHKIEYFDTNKNKITFNIDDIVGSVKVVKLKNYDKQLKVFDKAVNEIKDEEKRVEKAKSKLEKEKTKITKDLDKLTEKEGNLSSETNTKKQKKLEKKYKKQRKALEKKQKKNEKATEKLDKDLEKFKEAREDALDLSNLYELIAYDADGKEIKLAYNKESKIYTYEVNRVKTTATSDEKVSTNKKEVNKYKKELAKYKKAKEKYDLLVSNSGVTAAGVMPKEPDKVKPKYKNVKKKHNVTQLVTDYTAENFTFQQSEGSKFLVLNLSGEQFPWTFHITTKGALLFRNAIGKDIDLDNIDRVKLLDGKGNLFSGRGYIWSRALPLFKDNILIGKGADTFIYYFPHRDYAGKYTERWRLELVVDKPHDFYIAMGINTGVVSLIAWLIMLLIYFIQGLMLYTRIRYKDFIYFIGLSLYIGIPGFLIAGIANDATVSVMPLFYGLLGIGVAANLILKKRYKDEVAKLALDGISIKEKYKQDEIKEKELLKAQKEKKRLKRKQKLEAKKLAREGKIKKSKSSNKKNEKELDGVLSHKKDKDSEDVEKTEEKKDKDKKGFSGFFSKKKNKDDDKDSEVKEETKSSSEESKEEPENDSSPDDSPKDETVESKTSETETSSEESKEEPETTQSSDESQTDGENNSQQNTSSDDTEQKDSDENDKDAE